MQLEKFSAKGNVFAEKAAFSVHVRQCKNEKPYINSPRHQFSSAKPYCELAESPLFFETSQSCVCTTVTLSHRFKSSPAIPGKVAIPGAAGYMMNAGHFSENLVSSGDLNRSPESRGPQPSACFCGTFCTPQKVPIRFPFGKFEVFQTSIQLAAMAASHEQN